MTAFLDTSVLVAALVEDESHHEACLALLSRRKPAASTHALAETFSTLTGGRLGLRVAPDVATELVESSLLPHLRLVELRATEIAKVLRQTAAAGVRGGAVYDFLHLAAARKAGAQVLYTLNARNFLAFVRAEDPRIQIPGE